MAEEGPGIDRGSLMAYARYYPSYTYTSLPYPSYTYPSYTCLLCGYPSYTTLPPRMVR